MKITAQDLLELQIIDTIIPEPEGGAHTDTAAMIAAVGDALHRCLDTVCALDTNTLLARRYAKYRAIGRFQQAQARLSGDDEPSVSLPF
jgi:acetyl-CoA carboxylase carboxyl transferase subunit alpha